MTGRLTAILVVLIGLYAKTLKLCNRQKEQHMATGDGAHKHLLWISTISIAFEVNRRRNIKLLIAAQSDNVVARVSLRISAVRLAVPVDFCFMNRHFN